MRSALQPQTGTYEEFAYTGGHPTGTAVAGHGTVWFAVQGGALGRLRPGEEQPTTFPLPSGNGYGVPIDPSGTVCTANGQSLVYAFDPTSETYRAISTGPGAWCLAAAPDGSI